MKTTITPCPSPRGTNFEHLYLVKAPRGVSAQGALDSAMRTMKRGGRDEEERDELRRELEALLERHVSEDGLMEAREDLADCLGDRKRYGDADRAHHHEADDEEERDDEHEHPDHEKLHAWAMRHGLGSDAEEELAALMMPRPGIERLGGRAVEDRHHRADDRRRHARDRLRRAQDREQQAEDSFFRFYPNARRIETM
jgi:hypothetical protein